jgi:hypothetical protein
MKTMGDRRIAPLPGRFTPGTHWTGGWVGPNDCLGAVVKRKNRYPCRELNPDRPARSSVTVLTWLFRRVTQQSKASIKVYSVLDYTHFPTESFETDLYIHLLLIKICCTCTFHLLYPLACSYSELTSETMNPCRYLVGLLGRGIGPSQGP